MTRCSKFLLVMILTLTLASCEDSPSQSKAKGQSQSPKERNLNPAEARPTFELQNLAVGTSYSCAVTKDKKYFAGGKI